MRNLKIVKSTNCCLLVETSKNSPIATSIRQKQFNIKQILIKLDLMFSEKIQIELHLLFLQIL